MIWLNVPLKDVTIERVRIENLENQRMKIVDEIGRASCRERV